MQAGLWNDADAVRDQNVRIGAGDNAKRDPGQLDRCLGEHPKPTISRHLKIDN
jgi:hypothetical protein